MFGRRTILAVLITIVAAIGLGVSGYLTWVTWQSGAVAGCTTDSYLDCDHVLSSRWSKWLGLPVSLLGGLTYVAILALCWPAAARPSSWAMTGLFALGLVAAGAAIWFIGLQAIVLQHFCLYCMTAHTCSLIVAVLTLLLFLDRSAGGEFQEIQTVFGASTLEADSDAFEQASGLCLAAALGFAALSLSALMGGQLLFDSSSDQGMEEIVFEPVDDTDTEPSMGLAIDIPEEDSAVSSSAAPSVSSDETQFDITAEPPSDATDDASFAIATDQPADQPSDAMDWLDEPIKDSPTMAPAIAEPSIDEPPITIGSLLDSGPRPIRFQALPDAIDVKAMPVLGNSDAPHVMIEMMDYTCKHCRELHPHVRDVLERYGDQLGVAIYHVPLSKKCNPLVRRDSPGKSNACEYARLAIGVWELAPEKFAEFHDFLLESERPPNVSKARRRALSLVGEEILLDKKVKAEIKKRISLQSPALKRLKSGLPVLLFPNGALRGVPKESQKLFDYLEGKLGVTPI